MGGSKRVVFTFAALGETGKSPFLAQSPDPVAASCQNFVRITLMTHIPDYAVVRRLKYVMQRNRQFDDAQSCAQMSPGF